MNAEHTTTVERLIEKADAGEPFLLLDVRNDDEYAAWKVEGCRPIETLHIPYFAFVEEPGLVTRVQSDRREVLVLCATGGSSEFGAEMLRAAGSNAKNVAGGMIAYGDYLQPVAVPLDPDEADRGMAPCTSGPGPSWPRRRCWASSTPKASQGEFLSKVVFDPCNKLFR